MDHHASVKDQLQRLRMSGALVNIDQRLTLASTGKLSPSDLLRQVLDDELATRSNRTLTRRLSRSRLDPTKTLETYDFRFNPKVSESTIRELATCNFIEQAQVLLILGPSGTGKSHLAQAIGHEACRRKFDVLAGRTDHIMRELWTAHADGSRKRKLKHINNVDLLILDDFGLIPLPQDQQNDLYEVICERYEKRATIFTSNRDFAEWMTVFDNPLIASAAMDRVIHRASLITLNGKSYRAEVFAKTQTNLKSKRTRQTS